MIVAPNRALSLSAFAERRLLAADFDRTIAGTDELSPSGLNVDRASYLSVSYVLGREALGPYVDDGGLRNRAPGQIVRQLRPDLSPSQWAQKRDDLVMYKQSLMVPQIGMRLPDGGLWPRPVPGFRESWDILQAYKEHGGKLDLGIISSGHDPFIDKFFEVHGFEPADFLISEDTIRTEVPDEDYAMYVKPSPLLMQMAHRKWAELHGLHDANEDDMTARTLYVGDDPEKDGHLASNAGVEFALINPAHPASSWQRVVTVLRSPRFEARHG